MKRLDEFSDEAREAGVHLRIDPEQLDRAARAGGGGLFHVPLLALCILVVARAKKGELATADLVAWTGATLSRYFSGIQAARRKLEWSLQHRRRCADALVFLENVRLINVQETPHRTVHCSHQGLDFARKLLRQPDEVGVLVRGLDRSYRAVELKGLELL